MQLEEFARQHQPKQGGGMFQLENPKLLEVKLDGTIMAKAGSMVSYTGDIAFERKSAGGLKGLLKKSATGEGAVTMAAEGQGYLYLADNGKKIQILDLDDGEKISVNGNDVLAFGDHVGWDIETMKSIAGAASGGLFNVALEGPGAIAITTHGDPIVLPTPVVTDPNATVAWSGTTPAVKTDIGAKDVIWGSSGENFQLAFEDDGGFVVVQPYEESAPGQQ